MNAPRAALEHLASPNRAVRPTGEDARAMAVYASEALETLDAIIERMKRDRDYHLAESARITRESLDIETASEGAYSIEDDAAESYHAGRAEAMEQAIQLLLGVEVSLYSETEQPA